MIVHLTPTHAHHTMNNENFSEDSLVNLPPHLTYQVGEDLYLHSPGAVFSVGSSKYCITAYTVFLILQYVAFFTSLPFEDVLNRASFCILADFYLIAVVILCILILPLGVSAIPDRPAYLSHLIASLLQFSCLVVQCCMLYVLCHSKGPFQVIPHMTAGEAHLEAVDVHLFLVIMGIVSTTLTIGSFCFSLCNVWIYGVGLGNLLKRTLHRIEAEDGSFTDRLLCPGERRIFNVYSISSKSPFSPEFRYPDELVVATHKSLV